MYYITKEINMPAQPQPVYNLKQETELHEMVYMFGGITDPTIVCIL